MKIWIIWVLTPLLCVCCFLSLAQTGSKVSPKKIPAKRTSAKSKSAEQASPKYASPDTIAIQKVPELAPPAIQDTTAKKDTSKIQEVAQIVHDSVKAQIKAPIVQIPVTLRSLIIPGVLFSYGVITLNNGTLQKLNRETKEVIWENNPHRKVHIEDYTLLAPAAAVYVLNFAGVKGNNNLVDRSVIYGMSNLIANGIVYGVKQLGIETRPDSSDRSSFPSGHTAEAFVSAEFARQEYRGITPWPAIGGYAIAIGTAYLRMYNNKHWLGDVVAGAGVGIASTRFSYYLYPIVKHILFGSRKIKGDAMFMPTYQNGAYGFAFIRKF